MAVNTAATAQMARFYGIPSRGGGALSDFWAQIMADVVGIPMHRQANPRIHNVLGMGLLAFSRLGKIATVDPLDHIFGSLPDFPVDPSNILPDHPEGEKLESHESEQDRKQGEDPLSRPVSAVDEAGDGQNNAETDAENGKQDAPVHDQLDGKLRK